MSFAIAYGDTNKKGGAITSLKNLLRFHFNEKMINFYAIIAFA